MSSIGLFIVGAIVTLIVAAAMGLLVWGAILDGRYEREQRLEHDEPKPGPPTIRVVDAA